MRDHGRFRQVLGPLLGLAVLAFASGAVLAGAPQVVVSGPSPFAGCDVSGEGGTNYLDAKVEPWIAANPASAGGLIAGWQQDRWDNGGARSLMSAYSRDGGSSWNRVVVPGIDKCSGGTGSFAFDRASDPWVAIAPDGTSYFMSLSFFDDRPDGGSGENAMLVSRSTDGGATWGQPTALIRDTDGRVFNDKNAMTADPRDARYVYATWDRLFDTGLPQVDAPSGTGAMQAGFSGRHDGVLMARQRLHARQSTAVPAGGAAVAQATADYYTGPTYFARTTNGGLSWEAARQIYDPGINAQTIGNVPVVLRDGTLLVFFTEITANGQTLLRFVRSRDHGASFGAPVTASNMNITQTCTVTPDSQQFVRDGCLLFDVAVDPANDRLYLVWQDGRVRNTDRVAFAMSSDRGSTWSTPVIINKTPGSPFALRTQAFVPSVEVASDSRVFVTYYDFRNDLRGPGSPEMVDYWAISCNSALTNCASPASWGQEVRLTPRSFNILNAPYAGGYFLGDYQGLVRQGKTAQALFGAATTPGQTDILTVRLR